MANVPKVPGMHPAFEDPGARNDQLLDVLDAGIQKFDESITILDALIYFDDRVEEFDAAVILAEDAWSDSSDVIDAVLDALEDGEFANDREKLDLEHRLQTLRSEESVLQEKYERMKKDLDELKERRKSLREKENQAGKEALEYLEYLRDFMKLSPMSVPVEE